jgi:RNA polymerase-binding transcription factor DksA
MQETDVQRFKAALLAERSQLEQELERVGRRNPTNPADWEPEPEALDISEADRNETADRIEAYEENSAILKELEARYQAVKLALDKIEQGTFGTCEISGEPIELDRLEANPAARTSKAHMDREGELPF